MLKKLLRRPRSTIPELVSQDPEHRVTARAGFFFLAFAGGYERIVTQYANLPGILLVATVALGCLILGMWAWAWIFGGALYLSARLLRGKPGAFASVSAVGYGFFWPGLLALTAPVALRVLRVLLTVLAPVMRMLLAPALLAVCLVLTIIRIAGQPATPPALAAAIYYHSFLRFYRGI